MVNAMKMFSVRVSIIIPILLLIIHSTNLEAVTFSVTQDSYTTGQSLKTSSNFGDYNIMRVRHTYPRTSFVEFDVSSLTGSNIQSAVLTLSVDKVYGDGVMDVSVINGNWSEDTITFDNQPNFGSPTVTVNLPQGLESTTFSIDITDIVQGWVDGGLVNYGVALFTSDASAKFYTKEGGKPATLEVVTSSEPPPPPGEPTGTHVNVPGDFNTIQKAVDAEGDTWCPDTANQCTVFVGPGVFAGFDIKNSNFPNRPFTIVGAGIGSTIIGGVYSSDYRIFELRNLTVDGQIKAEEDSNLFISNIKAKKFILGISSLARIAKSEIETLIGYESSLYVSFSSIGEIIIDETAFLELSNSIAGSAHLSYAGLKATNSRIYGEVDISEGSAIITNSHIDGSINLLDTNIKVGNSAVDGGFIITFAFDTSEMKCTNVIDSNLNLYQSDCSVAP